MKNLLKFLIIAGSLCIPLIVFAAPLTYYDLDFEDGTLGGGDIAFGTPTNVDSSNLDGKALEFSLDDQLRWNRYDTDSDTHYVGFDYFAEPGANITQFLDVPSILRLDVSETGRHHIDVYYDFSSQTALSYLDGNLNMSMLTVLAWPSITPWSRAIRIANQSSLPGGSTGIFQIDNLVWQGNVEMGEPVVPNPVPEPATMLLFGTSLAGLVGFRLRRKKR